MHKSVAREREQVMKYLRKRKTDDASLPCKVLRRLYGRLHPLHGEEGRQVGRVGADHDQGEEPPEGRDHPGGEGSGEKIMNIYGYIEKVLRCVPVINLNLRNSQ